MSTQLQYLSHSAIKLTSGTTSLLIDPFLSGNPTAPFGWEEAAKGATHIALTHGHGDHVGDTVQIAKAGNIPVVAMVEIASWLAKQGVEKTLQTNFGGTITLGEGASVTLVPAWHTSSMPDGSSGGLPAGLIIQMDGHSIYHAGDTSIFGDMALINELYKPDVVLLPIGGTYTMDARTAALAAHKYFPGAKHLIPLHYATFPVLAQDASDFIDDCKLMGLTATALKPGQTITL